MFIGTKYGKIALYCEGNQEGTPIIMLHGYPSNSTEWEHFMKALKWGNMRMIGIDMPGCGKSEGNPLSSRSDHNMDKDGPLDVVCEVLKALKISSAHFIGFDWGGGLVLSMAIKYPKYVKKVISFMPSYTEITPNELNKI